MPAMPLSRTAALAVIHQRGPGWKKPDTAYDVNPIQPGQTPARCQRPLHDAQRPQQRQRATPSASRGLTGHCQTGTASVARGFAGTSSAKRIPASPLCCPSDLSAQAKATDGEATKAWGKPIRDKP